MVEGLSKRIAGDWAELSEPSLSLSGILDYCGFSPEDLAGIARGVTSTVEGGVIEYKESLLVPLFGLLEEMKYKNIGFDALAAQNAEIDKLLFVTLVQRLYASGRVVSPEEHRSTHTEEQGPLDLKEILSDVMARIKAEPSLKSNNAVKLILTQLAIYQRERETMEKLKPNIKDAQKANAFRKNFAETFQKISGTIRKYYAEFIAGQTAEARQHTRVALDRIPLRGLLSLFTKQVREFLRIRSTISFAVEGKYKVREICVHILNEKETFFSLLDQEEASYRKLEKEAAGKIPELSLRSLFAAEIGFHTAKFVENDAASRAADNT
ncbi:MAG TPA: hypothetical protein ENN69_00675 [Spirochaetia bacterium]|nr:hypothetical protein [Spirochaetia bacterium]